MDERESPQLWGDLKNVQNSVKKGLQNLHINNVKSQLDSGNMRH